MKLKEKPIRYLPYVLTLFASFLSIALIYSIHKSHNSHLDRLTLTHAKNLLAVTDQQLDFRVKALQRMANRWFRNSNSVDTTLKSDFDEYLQDFSELFALACTDDTYNIRCYQDMHNNTPLVQNAEPWKGLLEQAKKDLSPKGVFLKSPTSDPLLLLAFPIKTDNGSYKFLLAFLDTNIFFEEFILKNKEIGLNFEIFVDEEKIYTSDSKKQSAQFLSTLSEKYGLNWAFRVWTSNEGNLLDQLILHRTLLLVSIFFTFFLLFGIAVFTREKKNRQKMERLLKIKDHFLDNMSHELRTPLNGIVANSSILSKTELEDKQKKLLDRIELSSKILDNLIDNILDFTKLQSETFTLSEIAFPVQSKVYQLIDSFQPFAIEKGLDLILHSEADVPETINCDPLRYIQILGNILSNSIKFTNKGKIEVFLSCTLHNQIKYLRCTVKDTGIGIPKEKITTIFEKFSQADPSPTRAFGGLGLGLTTAHNLITLMNGQIGIDSQQGVGTTLWFEIPISGIS